MKKLKQLEIKMKNRKNSVIIMFGLLMGFAELIPGIGGGTIAYIIGIYEEMMCAIGKCLSLKITFKERWIGIKFLLILGIPAILALIVFSNFVHFILLNYIEWIPFIMAGIVGIIIPSFLKLIYDNKEMRKNKINNIGFICGFLCILTVTIVAMILGENTVITETFQLPAPLILFIIGIIIGFAMLIPGIGTAFILVIIGAYSSIVFIIANIRIVIPSVVILLLGIMIGIFIFTKLINYWMEKYYQIFTMTNIGFLFGAILIFIAKIFSPLPLFFDTIKLIIMLILGFFVGSIIKKK